MQHLLVEFQFFLLCCYYPIAVDWKSQRQKQGEILIKYLFFFFFGKEYQLQVTWLVNILRVLEHEMGAGRPSLDAGTAPSPPQPGNWAVCVTQKCRPYYLDPALAHYLKFFNLNYSDDTQCQIIELCQALEFCFALISTRQKWNILFRRVFSSSA